MAISQKSYNKHLSPFYYPLRLLATLLTKKWGIKLFNSFAKLAKDNNIKGLDCEERYITSNNNGPDIRIRIFSPKNSDNNLPAILYNHGGGFMVGNPELSLDIIKQYIDARPCVVIAPDYRKSLKHPYPAGFNDCYDTLLWMKANSISLKINPTKFIIAGHSAGGGLTAAITLKARDTKDVDIAFQMPIYPMIDHRQNTDSAKTMIDTPVWNSKNSAFGWSLYLKNCKENIPAYASPSLNNNYKGFPPTITFVGDLEPFKDETISYVDSLKKENIPVTFKLFEGTFHSFETTAKNSAIAKEANEFMIDSFCEYYDRYVI